jgi:hypothetical protein
MLMNDCCASKNIAIDTRTACKKSIQPKFDKLFSIISSHDDIGLFSCSILE